jgi:hypothetical protein
VCLTLAILTYNDNNATSQRGIRLLAGSPLVGAATKDACIKAIGLAPLSHRRSPILRT